ncbi:MULTISPECIES: hypothetical protein [Paraclostridium]|uniref:Uncharacterized protein n=1 Tax=Paraclostridium bifermentans TaxID=1490 RepID=A0AA44IGW3_PARBF|nr:MULTISPECIES: hypothetical protein [Paraclostridium]MBN8046756.1 hypothetical protein [Paraclostridium bifermentans]MBZ6007256.1 hypothetical protein [Paraclostridium bifermentans]MCR1874813.1 hypothetical protein [Paraclostridium bifermentans]MDU0295856.1 hypothetical protein [Paraclostridium sp. MRS3W1]NME09174.1 hypothetical protein [Paraclostridium bifermentans]
MRKKENNDTKKNIEEVTMYENMNFNDIDSLSGDLDNTLTNLFLSLNSDNIKKKTKKHK